ncbi:MULTISPECIES: CGNR zinc finger domain-containing protein [unclassified Streptomyces]|uniref:CGNR zinc finger domain-containing protein n=1 Tax=unclassified Streptomyces TaxID=2593676 RepID=UPI002E362DF9|nr:MULTISPECIES: CGNR zinc finger domain-containing protein [unclassified Streptomyces]WUC67251.1 CGNR zinc finger domain-containing protein [Streptomyces sp. NBC_00539]
MFDSHVAVLLEQAVSLVNTLTDGESRGRPYAAPRGAELPQAIDAAVSRHAASLPRDIDSAQAQYMAEAAGRMREVFRAMQDAEPDAAARAVNALLRDTAARPRLDRAEGGPWQVHFHGANDSFAAGCSASCATALALAVGGGLAGRLGVCRADRCDRVYVDTSRNAARQFCSTACQNRTKAAAFRARKG